MLDLCLRLDKPQLPPSLTSVPDLHISVPAPAVTANQEVLSAVRSIVGKDAVQDSVWGESIYFIGEMNVMFLCSFLFIIISSLVLKWY